MAVSQRKTLYIGTGYSFLQSLGHISQYFSHYFFQNSSHSSPNHLGTAVNFTFKMQ